jgi:hypothetical protein
MSNMFQALIAKPATDAAAVTVTAPKASKPASKPAPKGRTVRKATPANSAAIKFAIAQGVGRPVAGNALKAHTAAFLDASEMSTNCDVPRALCVKVIGARAVQYHLDQGNFEATAGGIQLTEKGEFLFVQFRTIDPELMAAYSAYFKDGKFNDKINVKNSAAVVKV